VLARDPGHLATQESLCFLLGAVGRMRETATRRIAMNGPGTMRPSMQCRVAFCYWFLGRIEEADRVLGRAAEMWPGNHSVWIFRFFILSGTGRFERALAHVTDPAGRPPLPPPMLEGLRLSTVAALSGTEADRARAVEALMPRLRESPAAVVNALMLLNLIGAIDAAFDVADAYFLERGPLIAALRWRPGGEIQINSSRRKTNPLFVPSSAPMRADPRFGPLTEAMGLGRYWRERGIEPDFRRFA
jgi:tetratricopeptide (TPR) repeat protein